MNDNMFAYFPNLKQKLLYMLKKVSHTNLIYLFFPIISETKSLLLFSSIDKGTQSVLPTYFCFSMLTMSNESWSAAISLLGERTLNYPTQMMMDRRMKNLLTDVINILLLASQVLLLIVIKDYRVDLLSPCDY